MELNLLEEVTRTICTALAQWRSYSCYVIGSSVESTNSRDLDIFVCDETRTDGYWVNHIHGLRLAILNGRGLEGAFNPVDATFAGAVERLTREVASQHPPFKVITGYAVGPSRHELDIPPDTVHLHICGPLSSNEIAAFAVSLPFHYAAFLQSNRALGNAPPLSELAVNPPLTIEELAAWNRAAHNSATRSNSLAVKRKLIGRIFLNLFLSQGRSDALARSLAELRQRLSSIDAEDPIQLDQVANAALEESLLGL